MNPNNRILVLGDTTIDWHVVKAQEFSTETVSWQTPGGNVAARPGGAKLLRYLFEQCLSCEIDPKEENATNVATNLKNVRQETSLTETMTICAPFPQDLQSKAKVLRVANLYVYRPSKFPPSPDTINAIDGTRIPDGIVIDDSGNGIRTQVTEVLAFLLSISKTAESVTPWIVLKVAWPVLENRLLVELAKLWGHRLVVVAPLDDLRSDNVQLSRGLSWERTAQDLSWEYNYNPRMKVFAGIQALVVPIGLSGVWFSQGDGRNKRSGTSCIESTLVFDPGCIEGDWEKDRPGLVLGYSSCLTLTIVRELLKGGQPDLTRAAKVGLAVMRTFHTNGYHIDAQSETIELPITEMRKALEDELDFPAVSVPLGYRYYSVPGSGHAEFNHPPEWSILRATVGSSSLLFDLGMKIVKDGVIQSLGIIPYACFGELTTVDRNEIEAFRTTYNLIQDYCKNQSLHRPLSLAVFGPPGSGKSFGVSQVAKAVAGKVIEKITFNVSQFNSVDDLSNAFHRVRDIGLAGKTPLVFWDEFDSAKDGTRLFWLKTFLAPMEDGEFTQGQINHPIGRAIFVFAGGTACSIEELGSGLPDEEYRSAKVIDFKSRLRGCINIVGIDRVSRWRGDERIIENDPQYVVRRAIILRSIIEHSRPDVINKNGQVKIDDGLLKALLSVWTFKHGARSLKSIVELCHLGDTGVLHRSSLPPQEVLALHVDTHEFLGLITADVEFRGVDLEALASAYHEMYRKKSPQSRLANLTYEQLSEDDKNKNRSAVRGIPHKLATIGYTYDLQPLEDANAIGPLDDLDAEKLARLEHDRWIVDAIDNGYIYGQTRDDTAFPHKHPDLVPWDDLDENAVSLRYPEYIALKLGHGPLRNSVDIELAKQIPEIMRSAGYRVVKL